MSARITELLSAIADFKAFHEEALRKQREGWQAERETYVAGLEAAKDEAAKEHAEHLTDVERLTVELKAAHDAGDDAAVDAIIKDLHEAVGKVAEKVAEPIVEAPAPVEAPVVEPAPEAPRADEAPVQ